MAIIDLGGSAFGAAAFGAAEVVESTLLDVDGLAIGIGSLTASLEVGSVPDSICQTSVRSFRWGHQYGFGDLELCVTGKGGNPLGPVCISYTLYQIQRGCVPRQVGPSGRKPGNRSVGCYYATGTAGECGQPGLWMVRWNYQKTFGATPIEKCCYFYVLDSVLCPVPGDTLPRACAYGWVDVAPIIPIVEPIIPIEEPPPEPTEPEPTEEPPPEPEPEPTEEPVEETISENVILEAPILQLRRRGRGT